MIERVVPTIDDRTPQQRMTHRLAIVGRDKALSRLNGSPGKYSRAAWACGPDVNIDRVEQWVKARGDMQYVTIVDLSTYRPRSRNTSHFHIYVATERNEA